MRANDKQTNICGGKLRPKIHPADDDEMVREGLRVPSLDINRAIFKHTIADVKQLKQFKKEVNHNLVPLLAAPVYHSEFSGKLIIYMKKSNVKNYKSTHSYCVYPSDIPQTLLDLKNAGYILNKAYFNHKRVL